MSISGLVSLLNRQLACNFFPKCSTNLCKVSTNKLSHSLASRMEIYARLSSLRFSIHVDEKIINLLTMSGVCHTHSKHARTFPRDRWVNNSEIDLSETRKLFCDTHHSSALSLSLHPTAQPKWRTCNYFNCSFVLLNGFQFAFPSTAFAAAALPLSARSLAISVCLTTNLLGESGARGFIIKHWKCIARNRLIRLKLMISF